MMDRKGYEQIPIPEELDEVVQGAIAQGLSRQDAETQLREAEQWREKPSGD